MNPGFGLAVECLVAVLLMLTIIFCVVLNKRLKKLRADEQALKATISELITATEIAERAIAGLKLTVRDCDQNLSERLRDGDVLAGELARQLESGRHILGQLAQITVAARTPQAAPAAIATPPQPSHDAHATAQAAAKFAARARHRMNQAA